mmetsp:Transcript_15568/g.55410  ORF Transcript_15568/g.55410 Transcript_15568/m.55410 type:complete len:214 (-) Transcript_15568:56-697(-)
MPRALREAREDAGRLFDVARRQVERAVQLRPREPRVAPRARRGGVRPPRRRRRLWGHFGRDAPRGHRRIDRGPIRLGPPIARAPLRRRLPRRRRFGATRRCRRPPARGEAIRAVPTRARPQRRRRRRHHIAGHCWRRAVPPRRRRRRRRQRSRGTHRGRKRRRERRQRRRRRAARSRQGGQGRVAGEGRAARLPVRAATQPRAVRRRPRNRRP